jgi:ribose 5-phosphate isomerase RpiB
MLLGVTTGEHGTGFAGAANAGTDIGAADTRASTSAFMTRLHIWTVVVFGISASAGPAPGSQIQDD